MQRLKKQGMWGFFLTILVATLSACLDKVNLNLPSDQRIVVEGEIVLDRTNPTQVREHIITLRKSVDYLSKDPMPIISDAIVFVEDSEGKRETFTSTSTPDSYRAHFVAHGGRTYTLHIQLPNGERYEAKDVMPKSKASIVAITMIEDSDGESSSSYQGSTASIYLTNKQPSIMFSDPADEENYYDYQVYNNDGKLSSVQRDFRRTPVLSDVGINGQTTSRILVFERPFFVNDLVRVHLLSISKENYEFRNAINTIYQGENSGSLFDAPKPPILGNISNLTHPDKPGLGFFSTVSYTSDTVVVR